MKQLFVRNGHTKNATMNVSSISIVGSICPEVFPKLWHRGVVDKQWAIVSLGKNNRSEFGIVE